MSGIAKAGRNFMKAIWAIDHNVASHGRIVGGAVIITFALSFAFTSMTTTDYCESRPARGVAPHPAPFPEALLSGGGPGPAARVLDPRAGCGLEPGRSLI